MHEFGHAAAAIISGGHVKCVVWHLTEISRTDVAPNPHPLIVCWAGPLAGCVVPAVFAASLYKFPGLLFGTVKFFAGFCLIANGAYLSFGSIDRIGDAGELLKLGVNEWLLWSFGVSSICGGFWIWHRLGRLSDVKRLPVKTIHVAVQICLLVLTLSLQEFNRNVQLDDGKQGNSALSRTGSYE